MDQASLISRSAPSFDSSYLMEVRHLDVRASGFLTSIPFFVGSVSTVIGGALFDRVFHGNPRRLIVPVMILSGIFLWMILRPLQGDRLQRGRDATPR
jgi:MFS family permease